MDDAEEVSALRAEYTALLARSGLSVPAERDGVMFEAFRVQREALSALHRDWRWADEPATVFARIPEGVR